MPKRKSTGNTPESPKKIRFSEDSKFQKPTKDKPKSGAAERDLHLSDLIHEPSWNEALNEELQAPYFKELEKKLAADYEAGKKIFPPQKLIFNAFNTTPLDKVKVVILGQDPYHDDEQAHGLSFSVPRGVRVPPSLKNIYKELATDVPGFKDPSHGCLLEWAERGVMLLNATLTVEAHQPNSHAKYGWQKFTDKVIKVISDSCDGVVFILWGGFAQKKDKLINGNKHTIIKAAHPSPLSVTKFLGCKCFSKANAELAKRGKSPVDWTL
ncbi:uracil-DNA glycosylase-like [Liolophura sinensis]|uniref:uracil-DNA glycosylase-like n=1 Tax=Liolophura sinensis TaxID=3198878 RepID=UPI003158BE37